MTGRELILYIVENHLEDFEMFDDNMLPKVMTVDETALKWGCGPSTVKALIDMGTVKGIKTKTMYLVLMSNKNPFKKGDDN